MANALPELDKVGALLKDAYQKAETALDEHYSKINRNSDRELLVANLGTLNSKLRDFTKIQKDFFSNSNEDTEAANRHLESIKKIFEKYPDLATLPLYKEVFDEPQQAQINTLLKLANKQHISDEELKTVVLNE